ncbi:MAG: arylsulfatase [Planctomycetota bacterium]|jgi:arylsulfatase A-like enzyme
MSTATSKPNVIIVLTDDQGYGDLGCTGNPWIQTPNIDRFHAESVRFNDFHVQPLCTPTRGAIMSGRRPIRNGAWATCWGRSILRADETTIADCFKAGGYRTGLFGKWHLGDNYPYRPYDRGFEHVVAHHGGGVGQTPDFWGNNYFDDTYFHNGQAREHTGYCTDVWFEEADKFITACDGAPFFAMITTNAPHCPYLVADKYKDLYSDNPDIPEPGFYGMITNIDENFGKLDTRLEELGIKDNTILIFMTDNGSSGGSQLDGEAFVTAGHNAGMRGMKGSFYDGGHRVPFILRWAGGGFEGGKDIDDLCLDIDMLSTLTELCGIEAKTENPVDGRSFAPLLRGETEELPDRQHFLMNKQGTEIPDIWQSAVMTRQYRLVRGAELFDIKADPGQRNDIAEEKPDVVQELRAAHEAWWAEVLPGLEEYCPIHIGNETENPSKLTAMDVMGDVAWAQHMIAAAQRSTGRWTVQADTPGTYRFTLRRWPKELTIPMETNVSQEFVERCVYPGGSKPSSFKPASARIKIYDQEARSEVTAGAEEVVFEMDLEEAGPTTLDAWFTDSDGEERGAYYVYVERLGVRSSLFTFH